MVTSAKFPDLDLPENFPSSAIIKLAKRVFGKKPFSCNDLHAAHIKFFGKETRNKKKCATSISQLLDRGYLKRADHRSDEGLVLYIILDKEHKFPKSSLLHASVVLKYIKEHFADGNFGRQELRKSMDIDHDLRSQLKTLQKQKKIGRIGHNAKGAIYQLIQNTPEQKKIVETENVQPTGDIEEIDIQEIEDDLIQNEKEEIEEKMHLVQRNETPAVINMDTLASMGIPLELLGEAIVANMTVLKRSIGDEQIQNERYKRRLDDANKQIRAQSEIIKNLNAKITRLTDEKLRPKTKGITLGEVATFSVLKNK